MTDAQVRYHQMMETRRHNAAQEVLSAYATDKQTEATRYTADQKYSGEVYKADANVKSSKYSADTNAATQRYVSDQNASTQRYAAELNAATERAKLELNRQVQLVSNSLKAKELRLEQLRTQAQNANTRAQTQKLLTETSNSLKQLELQARELGLKEEAAKYSNALNKAKKYETDSKTVGNWIANAKSFYSGVKTLLSDITGSLHQTAD